ncbi:MAG: acyl-CoA desaturase [Bacteroidetes bacterium]|nr:acyl-CoA desaturase [Bacteroidota bacterium]
MSSGQPIKSQLLKFSKDEHSEFIVVLRKRVNAYFTENNISKFGNRHMVFKTIFMLALFFIPYAFVVSGMITNNLVYMLLWVIMGVGTSGIGLSIMHDANHGSLSKNKRVNTVLSYVLEFVGGSHANWQIQHNKLHHTFTNVVGFDEDIKSNYVLRFAPSQPRRGFHRFQFIYAWFLYCLMTIFWVTTKDFSQLKRYIRFGLIKEADYSKLLFQMIIWKLFFYGYLLVLPMVLSSVPAYFTIIGFVTMLAISGLALSCVFQPAHVVPTSEFPVGNENGVLDNSWAIHQLRTTSDFARGNRFLTWFIGGLNFQVEHHLFPNICHIHYKKMSEIVEATAKEYNLPYHFEKTYVGALWSHGKMLYRLGNNDVAYSHT